MQKQNLPACSDVVTTTKPKTTTTVMTTTSFPAAALSGSSIDVRSFEHSTGVIHQISWAKAIV